jgi:hypothetical protein
VSLVRELSEARSEITALVSDKTYLLDQLYKLRNRDAKLQAQLTAMTVWHCWHGEVVVIVDDSTRLIGNCSKPSRS